MTKAQMISMLRTHAKEYGVKLPRLSKLRVDEIRQVCWRHDLEIPIKISMGKRMSDIQRRDTPNDCVYTPEPLAIYHIQKVATMYANDLIGSEWLDPFKGGGVYYNNYPWGVVKSWCEIDEGVDFFDYDGSPEFVVSNPPYSKMRRVLDKLFDLSPRVISLLVCQSAVTPPRVALLYEAGYVMVNQEIMSVKDFGFGIISIVTFEKSSSAKSVLEFNRINWRKEEKQYTMKQENDEVYDCDEF